MTKEVPGLTKLTPQKAETTLEALFALARSLLPNLAGLP